MRPGSTSTRIGGAGIGPAGWRSGPDGAVVSFLTAGDGRSYGRGGRRFGGGGDGVVSIAAFRAFSRSNRWIIVPILGGLDGDGTAVAGSSAKGPSMGPGTVGVSLGWASNSASQRLISANASCSLDIPIVSVL